MSANLLSLVQQALGGDFSKLAGQFLGESQGATQSALSSLLPAVIGGIAQRGATPQGALDSRMSSALGFASPGAFLGSLGGQAADTARRAGAVVAGDAATNEALAKKPASAVRDALEAAGGLKKTSR